MVAGHVSTDDVNSVSSHRSSNNKNHNHSLNNGQNAAAVPLHSVSTPAISPQQQLLPQGSLPYSANYLTAPPPPPPLSMSSSAATATAAAATAVNPLLGYHSMRDSMAYKYHCIHPNCKRSFKEEPELRAHLIAYNPGMAAENQFLRDSVLTLLDFVEKASNHIPFVQQAVSVVIILLLIAFVFLL
jgi:hypothetical protein